MVVLIFRFFSGYLIFANALIANFLLGLDFVIFPQFAQPVNFNCIKVVEGNTSMDILYEAHAFWKDYKVVLYRGKLIVGSYIG